MPATTRQLCRYPTCRHKVNRGGLCGTHTDMPRVCTHHPDHYVVGAAEGYAYSAPVCELPECIGLGLAEIAKRTGNIGTFVRGTRDPAADPMCCWPTTDGHPCQRLAVDFFGDNEEHMDLCQEHFDRITALAIYQLTDERDGDRFRSTGIYAAFLEEEGDRPLPKLNWVPPPPLIYYVRREQWVKIGTTSNLSKRMADLARGGVTIPVGMTLGPVELLASHLGDVAEEKALHARFAEHRVAGEWFHPAPDLLAHIASVHRMPNMQPI